MAHRRPTGGTSSPSSSSSSVTDNENAIRLLESLQNDFKCLSMETKKKYPQIKEASEEAIVKLRNSAAVAADHLQQQQQQSHHNHHQIYYVVNQILYPVVQGCETKEPKIVKMCLGTIQKLITHRAVDQKGARYITDTLWMLMESGTEHVKVLQSVTLLLTTDCVVRGETLARNLVLCFRLHFTKDSQAVINTAGATVRQLVALVFERVIQEDEQHEQQLKDCNNDDNRYDSQQQRNGVDSSVPSQDHRQQQSSKTQSLPQHHQYNGSNASGYEPASAVSSLGPCAADAYHMFQDLVRLVNTDRPYWLVGMTEMTRTFGLELLESVLSDFQPVFFKHMEFRYLLKERVCALVIKLFSPNVKHHSGNSSVRRNTITNTGTGAATVPGNNSSSVMMMGVTGGAGSPTSNHRSDDRPHYAITVRLLRLVSILVRKYHKLLITECEIFLSLIVKFLDADKPAWQRSVALEVLHRLVVEPGLLAAFCACYDLKLHSTKIFRDIIDSLAGYVQSLFNPNMVVSGGGSMNNAAMMATANAALQGQSPAVLAGMPVGPGVSPQPGFFGRGGVWLPVVIQLPTGQAKSIYLEMNDKHDEPPQVADGYGVSVAYACLVDAVRAIQIEVHPDIHQSVVSPPSTTAVSSNVGDDDRGRLCHTDDVSQKNALEEDDNSNDEQKQTTGVKRSPLHEQIINSSWYGLLTTFCPLIESCTDEGITENMLKAMQAYIGLCGLLDMRGPRDAFITAVCRACLPPHYNLTVFSGTVNTCCVGQPSMSSSSPTMQYATSATMYDDHHQQQYSSATGGGYGPESADYKQQQQVIVAVGTPLATPSSVLQNSSPSGASLQNHGPVMLTAKNLQCMRALLVLAHCHGSILGSSWHLVLTTLQHLVWILGLKPSTGGSLKAGNSAATSVPNRHSGVNTSATTTDGTGIGSLSSSASSVSTTLSSSNVAVITTAVMAADLPVLSTMLSRLFESSRYLDDVALHHLIDALCKLSHEAMELAYCNREPSLFAVAKLLETGLVNLSRIDILWRPVTNHLLDVCQHPHIRMREWGVEAITYLVKAALQYKYEPPLKDNQKLQTLLLSPLSQLSLNMNGDVRQRQLECVLQVLHGSGQTLSHGWPLVLNIVGAVSDRHGENLIRIAFQCLELILTDFLPLMPCKCLPLCLETTAKFGMQTRDLNISLTALGLMWNVADYFKDNKDKLLCNNSGSDISKQRGAGSETLTDSGKTIDSITLGITNSQELVYPDFPGVTTLAEMSEFDKLWMCLFTKLGELCIDPRPAVRKSAGQTLLSTISAHANLLTPSSWNAVLWQVLFPLMNKVQILCESASDTTCNTVAGSDGTGGSGGGGSSGSGSAGGGTILIHHSRNTDQKQWAETQVSTLYGLARVFNAEKYSMMVGGDFVKAWTLLLEYMEKAALNRNVEVSLAGLRSLHELLMVYSNSNNVGDGTNMTPSDKHTTAIDRTQREEDWQSKNRVSGSNTSAMAPPSPILENEIWTTTWSVWMRIATAATETTVVENPINLPSTATINSGSSTAGTEDRRRREYPIQQHHQSLQHKQKFLTALLQIFPLIFTRIKARFTDQDLNDLFRVLDAAAAVDGSAAVVLSDHNHQYYHHQQQLQQQNYYGGSYSQQQLTRLQDEILQCLETLERETLIFDDEEFGGTSTSNIADNVTASSDIGYIDKKISTMSIEQQQHRHELVQRFLCPLFDQLLKFCRFVCPPLPPSTPNTGGDKQQMTNGAAAVDHFHHHNKFAAAVAVDSNYVAFGEKAVLMIVDLYGMTAAETCVVKGEILRRIIEVFSVPLAGRYSSYPTSAPPFNYHIDATPLSSGSTQQQQQQHVQQQQQQHLMLVRRRQQQQQNTWKLLVVGLMNVLSVGVPLARDCAGDDYISIWSPLGSVLEDILFPKNLPPASSMLKSNKLMDDNDENDSVIIDCQLVEFLKDEILSQSTNVPREFIMRVVVLLNRGSVLSTTTASTLPNYPYGGGYDTMMMVDCRDGGVSGSVAGPGVGGFSPPSLLREQFAKVCFETLLQFSLVDGISSSSSPPPTDTVANNGGNDSNADAELITGKLAVTALLHRFQEVVEKFCHDQSLTGKCPLPRYRMSEISFVLKAIATLIVSLKKTPDKVSKAVWDQLIRLYPCLVRCVPYTQQCCSSPQVTDSLTEALLQFGDLLLKTPPSTAADAQQQ